MEPAVASRVMPGNVWEQVSLVELLERLDASSPDSPARATTARPDTAATVPAGEAIGALAPVVPLADSQAPGPAAATQAATELVTDLTTTVAMNVATDDSVAAGSAGPGIAAITTEAPGASRPRGSAQASASAVQLTGHQAAGPVPAGERRRSAACRLPGGDGGASASPQLAARPGPDSGDPHGAPAAGSSQGPTDDALPPCPQRLLILDTETTALSPQHGQCIEVGAVLFDVSSRSALMQLSFLLPCEQNPAQHVNGIAAEVSRLSQPWRDGLGCFLAMVASADALLAHNVAFDRQWFGHGELPALHKPWICSMEDIRWPADRHLRATPSVRDLALAYGVPVWAAHRALTDCIYLLQVFQRCNDLELLLQQALEPRRLVRARLSYEQRQLAKDAGFRWNDPLPKAWSRRLSDREIAALPFAVDSVEPDAPEAADAERQRSPSSWRRRSA